MDKKKSPDAPTGVISLVDYKKNKEEERKREYERILFQRILGVYGYAEKSKLHHIEVLDISYSGLKFRETQAQAGGEKPLSVGEKMALRFYFTPATFVRVVVEVKRVTPFDEDGKNGLEYGCELDKNTKSYEMVKSLVAFLHKYAEVASPDSKPPMVWF